MKSNKEIIEYCEKAIQTTFETRAKIEGREKYINRVCDIEIGKRMAFEEIIGLLKINEAQPITISFGSKEIKQLDDNVKYHGASHLEIHSIKYKIIKVNVERNTVLCEKVDND